MKSKGLLSLAALAIAVAMALPAGAASAPTAGIATVSTGGLHDAGRYDRFIVRYRDGSTERFDTGAASQGVAAAMSRFVGAGKARSAPPSARALRRMSSGSTVFRLSRKLDADEARAFMAQVASDAAVLHVEPDLMMHAVRDTRAAAVTAPDDPLYADYQWDFSDPVGGANLPGVWNSFPGVDGTGITVAVIDTGITAHEDLDASLAPDGYDFISDRFVSGRDSDDRVPGGWDLGDWTDAEPWQSQCTDGSNPPESSSWHGTNVAGVIGEVTGNGIGFAGAAPGVKVLPIRALGHCGGYTSDIADAIEWASGGHVDGVPDNTHPAQVINMSLGGGGACNQDGVTSAAVADAIGRGSTIVVAAGNADDDAANYTPASCPGVVTVASTGVTGKRAFYSNYGSTVTLAAPGGGIYNNDSSGGAQANPLGFIWSAFNAGTTTPVAVEDGGSSYAGMAGTSQATPHVAATVALMLDAVARAGDAVPSVAQVKSMLAASTRPFPITPDASVGSGILDAQAAVATALGVSLPPQVTALVQGRMSAPQQRAAGGSSLFSLDVPAGARNLVIRSIGGTGDASLFVKAGTIPADDGADADARSVHAGNAESIVLARPLATTYYVRLSAAKDFSKVTVLATYVSP